MSPIYKTSDPLELRVLRALYREWLESGSLLSFDEFIKS
jgi:hypothetical protein